MENLNKFEIQTWHTDGCIRIWCTNAQDRSDALQQFICDMYDKKEVRYLKNLNKLCINQKSFN